MCAPGDPFRVTRRVSVGVEGANEETPMTDHIDVADWMRDWNESQVLAGLRAGQDWAYELILRRYGARMLATARRLLRCDEEAKDAVQEAMLSAFRAAGQFAGDAQIGTWLHRIVVNAALMRLRVRKRKPESSIEDLLPTYLSDGHRAASASSELFPDEVLEQAQLLRLLRECSAELPEAYRQVYLLRDIDEMPSEDVAALLGITPNAVKIRLHRARQALMTLVQRRYAGHAEVRRATPVAVRHGSDRQASNP
jgi:RNA polymerase sigma-70 factor (ECF subfamily)